MKTIKEKDSFVCSYCRYPQSCEIIPVVSLSDTPELKEKIMDGTFFDQVCEKCGKAETVLHDLAYIDEENKLCLIMRLDEEEEAGEEEEVYLDLGYTVRTVRSYEQLVEKIMIRDYQMDDRLVELMKAASYMILKQAHKIDADEIFFSVDDDGPYFVFFQKGGKQGGGRLPFMKGMYEDMEERFAKKADIFFKSETEIDFAWAAEFFQKTYGSKS